MKYLKYFENSAAVGSGVEVNLPNVSYLQEANVLFVPGSNDTATVVYNSTTGEIEVETGPTYEYVDLGLPSGTLWCTKNVGAETEYDSGLYFAWGEIEGYPYATSTKQFTWNDYKWGPYPPTKYNETDLLVTLELADDAANVDMGGNWIMPTLAQVQELTANTTCEKYVDKSKEFAGCRITSTINGQSFLIPMAGEFYNGQKQNADFCFIWTSTANSRGRAYQFYYRDGFGMYIEGDCDRYQGIPVRGVINP